MSIVMYDTVTVETVPPNPQAVAGYVGGKWPTYNELVAKFPHAKHLSIAVNASEDAECLDIEVGDAVPDQAPGWFARQKARGVSKPCLYASLSVCHDVEAAMGAAGHPRASYRLWSAHYTFSPHICGPSEGLPVPADATQWTDRALNSNLDESLCNDAFFGAQQAYRNPQEVNWIREWDRIRTRKTPAAHLRRLFLKDQMIKRRSLISHKAESEHDGWHKLNRIARWHALRDRTGP